MPWLASLLIIPFLVAARPAQYPESLRPQIHFTAPSGWLNDPNGLVYHHGEYHLFFQHNPSGTQWGNMTWGHAVSTDLLHWKNLPNAIEPDSLGTIFSGSAVIDHDNTAGFGKNALVCIYTAAGGTNPESQGKPFSQCLAYSLNGRTFKKYEGNPVLPNLSDGNRDPKVIWHEPTKKWVLALYTAPHTYALFGSPDLKVWTKLSDVSMPDTDECPDFFEIPLEGTSTKKWVFSGANGNYRVGTFDGTTFKPETAVLRSHHGNTGYAGQTYSNLPDGRRIQIEWMQGSEFPGTPWNQQMTIPNELNLRKTTAGPRLFFQPAREIATIRAHSLPPLADTPAGTPPNTLLFPAKSDLIEFTLNSKIPVHGWIEIEIAGRKVRYDADQKALKVLDKTIEMSGQTLDLHLISDRTSLEIYAQKGLYWIPIFALPTKEASTEIKVSREGAWNPKIKAYELRQSYNPTGS